MVFSRLDLLPDVPRADLRFAQLPPVLLEPRRQMENRPDRRTRHDSVNIGQGREQIRQHCQMIYPEAPEWPLRCYLNG
jgi:hypothetical protein